MAKAVVMQVTDIKNRRQDMNTRQFLFIAADSIRPLRRTIRTLPKIWLAVVLTTSLVFFSLPALAAPKHGTPEHAVPEPATPEHVAQRQQSTELPTLWQVASNAGSGPEAVAATAAASTTDSASAQQAHSHQTIDKSMATNGVDDQGRADWRELEQGLFFGEFQLNDGDARLSVLRIDPAYFDFTLCARSQDSGPSRPLNEWGEQYNLSAAINASMYLPDGSTSTGYMRQGNHTNNGRIVQRFGAFFVAGPDEPGLPLAAILDRDSPLWRQQMERYSLVIQNYRMINADRRILWSPGGPHYSISAVAQDGEGQILFMHCRQPVEAYAFAQQVLHLPLNVRTVMYVEGGGQAGLLVRSAALTRELVGLSPSGLLVTGDLRAVLPNVLGARRKGAPAHPAESTTENSGENSGERQGQPVSSPATPANSAASGPAAAAESGPMPASTTGADAGATQQQNPALQGAAGVAAPLLAPSHTVRLAPSHSTAPNTAAKPASAPAAEPLTEPGTSLAQPPAGSPALHLPVTDKQLKK